MAEQPVQKDFKTVDIVDFAMQGNPKKINDAFGQIISNKVVDSLANKKQEMSISYLQSIGEPKIEEPAVEVSAEPEAETTEEQ